MQKSEVAAVLAFASGADRRVVDQIAVESWWQLIGHLDFDLVMAAVRKHYQEEVVPVLPGHVLRRIGDPYEGMREFT